MTSTNHVSENLRVANLLVTEDGKVTEQFPEIEKARQLNNTLLAAEHPGIRVVTLQLPTGFLDPPEEATVKKAMMCVRYEGREYYPVGASGSAKDGKIYAVPAEYVKPLKERFRGVPESAITYFGIMVSDCRVVIQEPDVKILVVQDHALGTNDCRGWVSERLFRKLKLRDHCFYQFRLALERCQAKGAFKVMGNDVAELVGAEIILPESSFKPSLELNVLSECQKWCAGIATGIRGLRIRSSITLGIRDYSRDLAFKSSYTLVQYASRESLETEILPRALEEAQDVVSSALSGNYDKLFELIGTSSAQGRVEDAENNTFTSYEHSIVEAVLKADGEGCMVRQGFINGKLNRQLADWAWRLCTGGGFRMPARALADDGVLFVHGNQVFAASDWIPKEGSISSLSCKTGLVVRFPIRMKEDLLPIHMLSSEETVRILEHVLRDIGCKMDRELIVDLVARQLSLDGTFTLHSETAAQNGGDYDFDPVCIVEDSAFPLFVASRFAMDKVHQIQKTKTDKLESRWWSFEAVAMKARGNQIGRITNLISDCVAANRSDLAYELVKQLQNALDSLKWRVPVDHKRIREIRDLVPRAKWLKAKGAERISDMPVTVSLSSESDNVGILYNYVRTHIGVLFEKVDPLSAFAGMIRGHEYTPKMQQECRKFNRAYGILVSEQRKRTAALTVKFNVAQKNFEAAPRDRNSAARQAAGKRLSRASTALRENEERCRKEMRNFHAVVHQWGSGKRENRKGWCQALHELAVQSKHPQATGAIVFHAFAQEVVDSLLGETGGRNIQLDLPEMPDGEIVFDESGHVYRLERDILESGLIRERRIFLFRIDEQGNILVDGVRVESVQPFLLQTGSGKIESGRVTFDLPQRPRVRNGIPPTLGTRQDRINFLKRCEQDFGPSFSVFVADDSRSVWQLDTAEKKREFIERATARPWEARAFETPEKE